MDTWSKCWPGGCSLGARAAEAAELACGAAASATAWHPTQARRRRVALLLHSRGSGRDPAPRQAMAQRSAHAAGGAATGAAARMLAMPGR